MTSTCFILLVAVVSPDSLKLICKPQLHNLQTLDFPYLSHKLSCEYVDSYGLPCCTGPAWSSCTQFLPAMCLPVMNLLKLGVLICFPIIDNCWGAGGKDVWDGLVTAIQVPVNCTGTSKDPLSRIPEDISRAEEVWMCVKASSVFCDTSFSRCK